MKRSAIVWFSVLCLASLPALSRPGVAQNSNSHNPTWWDKYTYIANNGPMGEGGATSSLSFGSNVDVSNECGPQSETFITINQSKPKTLAAGSNEIFRLPMRGYFSSAPFFSFEGGSNHFNDKPMITADTNISSPLRDNVYIAWDAAAGGSIGGGIRVGSSTDHGATFTVTRADNPSGPGRSIGASPAVGPNGELYVAWNDYSANVIAFNRSFDGGITWDQQRVVSPKIIPFDIAIPAESFRAALVYPALDVDRSQGSFRGRLYCSWMDKTQLGTDIFVSYSDDNGSTWSVPRTVTDVLPFAVDHFNHWMSVDPVTGEVNISFYDTRNDSTGFRYMTDVYLARSTDGGSSWLSPNIRVSTVSSNEHDCGGLFPCPGINYGNQQGDYEGVVSYGGVSYPIWTDSRRQLEQIAGCARGLAMEEVFTAKVKP